MLAKTKIEIGSEIESICTKCKIPTAHVITGLKGNTITKVMCKICLTYHKPKYEEKIMTSSRGKATAKKASPKSLKEKKPKTRESRKWNRLLKKVNFEDEEALDYHMSETYESDSVIRHPNFGVGVITDVTSKKKIQVFFQDGEKTLVHNWK